MTDPSKESLDRAREWWRAVGGKALPGSITSIGSTDAFIRAVEEYRVEQTALLLDAAIAEEREHPSRWSVGDIIKRKHPERTARLKERKADNSGWWLVGGYGLDDKPAIQGWERTR